MSRIEAKPATPPTSNQAAAPTEFTTWVAGPLAANAMLGGIASQLAQEMLDFAGRRMRAQLDFMAEVPRCGDVPQLIEAQFRFVETATRDYADEVGHVAEVIRKATAATNAS
ncbi:phasin family protein [Falsiroseomonas oryziterrae]|uniref:phasin family protein n=1 Tax=Falsiroseomonas oryziterrae TaxID=2911368 RepID=UPI001F40D736|nr:phasin family protein [Roseomonas sp. NPKOSM-4]